jgi:poly-beta-1,6-N-acetyl-D-glucosamine synthase
MLTYVLITPARNEAEFIERTIESVVGQTVRPLKWVVVSDGSTDGTDEIVEKFVARHPWIELVRIPERAERHFAGKVHAFNAGYARLSGLDYEVLGNLDADITFGSEYFGFLLAKFDSDPRLGVAGTPFVESGRHYDYRYTSLDHVSGACQLFRRECFEEIGGYMPLRQGGIDLAAVLTARLRGWRTRTFPEMTCEHRKETQIRGHASFRATFRSGYHDYLMGSHPLWHVCRSAYRMTERPLITGGLALLAGYCWASCVRAERLLPPETVRFRRMEQMQRLRAWPTRALR